VLWLAGTALHLVFTFYVMDVWIHHDKFEVHHINPAWFIPVVGNVLVPIAGMELGYTELSWFFFSIGMLFWLVLFAIIFYRVLFHNPLPGKLMPTFFILIAPPAVGFIACIKLTGDLDAFGRVLYYSGLFLTLLLLTQTKKVQPTPVFSFLVGLLVSIGSQHRGNVGDVSEDCNTNLCGTWPDLSWAVDHHRALPALQDLHGHRSAQNLYAGRVIDRSNAIFVTYLSR
jgi:hypothetical protein